MGKSDRVCDDYLNSVAEALSSIVPVRTTENIMGHLYSKLIIYSCITSLGAISGLYLGNMLLRNRIRKLFMRIIREAMEVAAKMDLRVEKFGGKLDFRIFMSPEGWLARTKCHLILLFIGYRYRRLKSSSLQSLERGKPTEVNYLNGYIADNGIKNGADVSLNILIVKTIHEIEQHKRAIGLQNFMNHEFDIF